MDHWLTGRDRLLRWPMYWLDEGYNARNRTPRDIILVRPWADSSHTITYWIPISSHNLISRFLASFTVGDDK